MSKPDVVYIVETVGGVLAIDENGQVIEKVPFERDPDKIADKFMALEGGELIDEVKELCERLREKGIKTIVVEDEELARRIASSFPGLEVKVEKPSRGGIIVRKDPTKYAPEFGLSPEEFRKLLFEATVIETRKKVRKAAEKRDLFIAQAISAIDDIDKTLNLFSSRLREWYSLHFPELNDMVRDHEDFVRLVYELGHRSNFSKEKLTKLGIPPARAERIAEAAKKSMGAEMTDFDLGPIKLVAGITLQLFDIRRKLASYIDEAMKEVAPNIRELVGPLLGARLIKLAGGLMKLAMLPASTIQVLGAEKALFRALRTGGKPPKHGVIFQFPAIFRSPRWQRGKIARALAAKLAIAARVDAFTGQFIAPKLKEDLMKRIEEIKRLYAKPPPRKPEARPTRRPRRR